MTGARGRKARRERPRRRGLVLQRLHSHFADPVWGRAAFKGAVDVPWRDRRTPETPFDNFDGDTDADKQRLHHGISAAESQCERSTQRRCPGWHPLWASEVQLLALSHFRSYSWGCTCARTKRARKTKQKNMSRR